MSSGYALVSTPGASNGRLQEPARVAAKRWAERSER